MKRKQLILDRYEIMGTAGAGGFGTVQIAWDPRIQRKVAIKTIQLSESDAVRAALSEAQGGTVRSTGSSSADEAKDTSDQNATQLIEEAAPRKQAFSPSEVRSMRFEAMKEEEERLQALTLEWENPWVRVPSEVSSSNVVDEANASSEMPFDNEAEGTSPEATTKKDDTEDEAEIESEVETTADVGRKDAAAVGVAITAEDAVGDKEELRGDRPQSDAAGARVASVSQKLSESLPTILNLPEVNVPDQKAVVSDQVETISPETTAEIPVIQQDAHEALLEQDANGEQAIESEPKAVLKAGDDPVSIISEARNTLKDLPDADIRDLWERRAEKTEDEASTDIPLRHFTQESDEELEPEPEHLSEPAQEVTQVYERESEANEGHASLQDALQGSQHEPDQDYEQEPITTLVHVPGLDEARTAAKLSDSRIVTVYDFEVRDQVAYLIMEYVEGITLTQLLDDYPNYITLDMVTGVFDSVAGALEIAHDAGVLHLDIKPDNIIINKDGQVKVTDFGLATLADAAGHGFAGGGTIGYMPLEQMRREQLDVRTDEWALAAMTYEMLTGGNPFKAATLRDAQTAILNAELVLPSLCWPRVDTQIDDVIFYALDPDREERYESIADFADEMDKFLGDPASGQEQLALVVEDALSEPEIQQSVSDAAPKSENAAATGVFGLFKRFGSPKVDAADQARSKRPVRAPLFASREEGGRGDRYEFPPSERLAEKLSKYGPDDALYEEDEYYEEEEEPVRREHVPLNQRVPDSLVNAAARIFTGIGSANVAALAFWNFEPIRSIPDAGALIGVVIGALIIGVLGVIIPTYGALVSFCLLGIVICLCGHPIVGAVLIIATGLWWYVVGREGVGDNNIALLTPLSMSVGASPIVPLFAGISLKPLQAALTMLFCVIVMCVYSSFGGDSFVELGSFAYPTFADSDITLAFARMFGRPLTYTMAAGWIAGAVLFSLLDLKARRWTFILGLIVCVACILVGTLVFAPPTPQLFIWLILGVAAILAVFL